MTDEPPQEEPYVSEEAQPTTESNTRPLRGKKLTVRDFSAEREIARAKAVAENVGDEDTPPRIQPSLKYAPKIGELYWCDLPKDAQLPELWKKRSVVVISLGVKMYGTAVIVPTTSVDPGNDPHLLKLSKSLDDRTSYAICDKPMTVAVSRFHLPGSGVKQRLDKDEVNEVIKKLHDVIPAPLPSKNDDNSE